MSRRLERRLHGFFFFFLFADAPGLATGTGWRAVRGVSGRGHEAIQALLRTGGRPYGKTVLLNALHLRVQHVEACLLMM
ncbi:hypothetical protein GGTG_02224 [Gaeumannomyces tritici R3-111a-1]|uniref:Secreted protein n=1 Tax=Gaeumannomyces tritici (strain R3-111a-1) TaxID=644352 RepID=J3NLS4_GAET3|nr:hypothetical protein GGTG_02224 [Gaeumannomyces tritici R3-111a-1]EJT82250.1 hypothetical protein GGTG_02224 [Gaeumannomyces tritici R3-111a-1]